MHLYVRLRLKLCIGIPTFAPSKKIVYLKNEKIHNRSANVGICHFGLRAIVEASRWGRIINIVRITYICLPFN